MDEHCYYTSEGAAEIDRLAIDQHGYVGLDLMRAAGQAAFQCLLDNLPANAKDLRVLIVCGSGNNGGDGYVIGEYCLKHGWAVTLVAIKPPRSLEAQQVRADFLSAGGEVNNELSMIEKAEFDVVVDALLGIGLQTAPRNEAADAIQLCNQKCGFKLALDVPSGINASTGHAYQPSFKADVTVTFIVDKVGLHTGGALNHCGRVQLEPISVGLDVVSKIAECAYKLPRELPGIRKADSHKGTYGHLLIAGANQGMLGAGLLAGEAALRAGCGKATLLSTERHRDSAAVYHPELMSAVYEGQMPTGMDAVEAIAVGPGLGLDSWSHSLLNAVLSLNKPTIIDADALTLLAESGELHLSHAVLTPHPGEAAKLLNTSSAVIQGDRLSSAIEIAQKYKAVCVLKGAGTIVASAEGKAWICDAGNPAMATAGMGDVLSGIVGALLAQGYGALDSAKIGVYWHAAVADHLVNNRGLRTLLASDVAKALSIQI